MFRFAVARFYIDDAAHEDLAAALSSIGTAFDMPGMSWTLGSDHSLRFDGQFFDWIFVDVSPFTLIELNSVLMDTLKTISVERRSILLFPDDILRESPAREGACRLEEITKATKNPHTASLSQSNSHRRRPTVNARIPIKGSIAVRRISDYDVDAQP